jgi:signal transduction histidine kinase
MIVCAELKQSRILLVDDGVSNVIAISACLSSLGYEVFTATCGADALVKFETDCPDLVLLDVRLPDIDGLRVLQEMRRHPTRGQTPVIVATAYADRQTHIRGLELGADDFLEKPLDVALLRARVKTLLSLKQSRDELSRRNATLERLQQQQRDLIDFIVHDLRAPLTVASASIDLLLERLEPGPAWVQRALDAAAAGHQRLDRLVADLLTVVRLQNGVMPFNFQTLALAAFVRESSAKHAVLAQAQNVTITATSESPAHVNVDAYLMSRVLDNLLGNALKYTPEGGTIHLHTQSQQHAEILIGNSGPEISSTERERIFDKFTHGKGASDGEAGTGIGLYFCRSVITALGGTIDVVDGTEFPTCFRIRLPLLAVS